MRSQVGIPTEPIFGMLVSNIHAQIAWSMKMGKQYKSIAAGIGKPLPVPRLILVGHGSLDDDLHHMSSSKSNFDKSIFHVVERFSFRKESNKYTKGHCKTQKHIK